jgi:uncharacterized protein (TIRG00374 family)
MQVFKKIVSIFFRVGISVVLLLFLFKSVDKKSLLDVIKNADKGLLFLAFLVASFSYLLCLFRWAMLLKAVDIILPLKRVIISFSGGIFFSLFLPSTIGGDLMRSIDLAAHTKRPREVIATVLLDRLSGYVGLAFFSLTAVIFGWKFVQDKSTLFCLAAIVGILLVILVVLFNKFLYGKINSLLRSPNAGRFRELITDLHEEIHVFKKQRKVIIYNIFVSVLVQALSPLVFFIVALSLGIKIKIIYFFVFIPIIGAITLLPISLGGLGLRDFSTVLFFAKAGVAKDMAFAMSLLNFFFILIYGILGGLIYVFTLRYRRLQYNQPSAFRKTCQ